ncbi:tetratricopeptide repeat protein [Kribbella turkmenica]|uniref:Tetratricopeptide repeat protein n=1 Tax=Kribbella turkmenica TaxID=2530375 RepID=A0A4R4WZ10_9ACTN|nr:tetratricopeptide repeat protein [Kribbella turkmenica]TDD23050.1 tetratricopeptide repeat protein [Kribbella turkmenica]
MNDERRGVYPFCAPCTASSIAWRPPDEAGATGIGSRFYGHRDVCEDCGSSIRTLYSTYLWIPVAKIGRFRIIPTGGRGYIGRKVVDRPVQTVVRQDAVSAHPELDGDPAYQQAEAYWRDSEPGRALPFYQSALTDREKRLPADDPATLRVRLRVAQGLLATANYGRAIAWFELMTPQLVEVFGPNHELTRAATEAVTGARLMVGGPRSEAKLLANIVAVDEQDLDRYDAQLLRDRAALGRALMACGEIADAIEALTQVVDDSMQALGASHPDAVVYRTALVDACHVTGTRGRKRDVQAAEAARRLLNDASAPRGT